MEKQKKQVLPFSHNHGGDDLSLGLSADLSRLRAELKALGGMFHAIVEAVERTREAPGAWILEVQEGPRRPLIPEEHLISYT